MHGKFTPSDAYAAGDVLAAYGGGLLALVLIASARASFQARGDTSTPMKIALAALTINVILKFVLFEPLGAVGLATATSVGLWINLAMLVALAIEKQLMAFDPLFFKSVFATTIAAIPLTCIALFLRTPILLFCAHFGVFANILALLFLGALGALVYALTLLLVLSRLGIDLKYFWTRAKR